MASNDGAPDGACLAASVIAGLRHLLIERGVWDQVRSTLVARDPTALEWIESELAVDPTKTEWVAATHYGLLWEAIVGVVGMDRTFALGRERLHRTAQAGAFAPVVRSWVRSFGEKPEEFLRLTTHAWSSQTKNFGSFKEAENRAGHARFVMEDASPILRESLGWRQFLSGYGTGLLDLIEREGQCRVEVAPTGRNVEIVFDYPPVTPQQHR
jgi:hypothetical protein